MGVTSPQTLLVRTHEDLYLARKAFGNRRMIMKPRFSRFGTKIHILSPRDDLHAIDIAGREWICQEYIEGPLLCSYSYAKAGVVVATVCYQDLLNKSGEASSVFIPVMNDQVNTTIATIVRYLRYSGSISFDFIVKDNVPYLIECNPRITSGVHCIANSDLYEIMYNNGQLDAPTAKKQIRFATIIRHRAWLRSVPDVSFSARDLLPTASYAWLIFQFLLVARRTNITFIEATTHDIEWNGDTI